MSDELNIYPLDDHNRKLISHVHPENWENPEPAGNYNMVVIGAGTAGLVTAAGAAGLGAKVALIEKHLMGGDCLNVGCVPSKALLSAAHTYGKVRDAGKYGVNVPVGTTVDFGAVMERMRTLRAEISHHDSAERFSDLGVDVFIGGGHFVSERAIEVNGARLNFSRACIATGARAAAPAIPGLDGVDYLTNENLFNLTALPKRMAVIGAGPIGCEMAQAFARFGSKVFLIEASHGVLPREDAEAAEVVKQSLLRDGIELLCCGKEIEISGGEGGVKRIKLESHEEGYEIEVDEILVVVGRAANVEGLGLDAGGVEYDKKGVKVNDALQTTNKRVYAAGDVCSKYQFTHAADFMARTVIRNALFPFLPTKAKVSDLIIPWATYTQPEIAHVGLYAEEAEEKGVGYDTYKIPFSSVDRALLEGDDEGFVSILTKKGKDEIIGCTIVSNHAGDLISQVTTAMKHKIGLGSIANVIHPYPTTAEVIRKAGDAYNKTRLSPGVAKLFKKLVSWQR